MIVILRVLECWSSWHTFHVNTRIIITTVKVITVINVIIQLKTNCIVQSSVNITGITLQSSLPRSQKLSLIILGRSWLIFTIQIQFYLIYISRSLFIKYWFS